MMIKLKLQLYLHQLKAVEKLVRLKVGALYMEMGTGKTLTALEIIRRRVEKGRLNRVIWLCPCSVKTDLRKNFQRSVDGWENLITICGIETLSSSKRENARLLDDALGTDCMLVVDESNLVKNSKAIRTKNITRLAALCKYRMILNGTPVSRNEADMFAQWYLLDWRILGYSSYYSFAANHLEFDKKYKHKIRRVLDVEYLTDKIAPYSYQVRKEDCLDLPKKMERTFYFSLTREQENHYFEMVSKYLSPEILDTDYDSSAIYRAFTICQQIASGRKIANKPIDSAIEHTAFFKTPEENPRIQALLTVLDKFDVDEKVVIWCKYTHEIKTVAQVLTDRGEQIELFYGEMSQRKRNDALERFSRASRILIANKSCAGYGLNLQYCSNAIYYNQDFDWATRAQSEDRLHRIGQTENVYLYNICAEGTIDERILNCLSRKESLVDAFRAAVGSMNMIDWFKEVETELIEKEILRDDAIRIGLTDTQKIAEIKRYINAHAEIKNIIIFSGDKFKMNLNEVDPQPETYSGDRTLVQIPEIDIPVQQISYSETEMYRTFYPLLAEIDESYLLVMNEMMRTSKRSELKLNCTAKYTNQSPHRLVFEYFPFISEPKDFMVLLDLSNSQLRKGIGFNEIDLSEIDVKCIRHHYELNVIPVELPDGAQEAYETERDRLFDDLGNKNPDTIPRHLHKWTGRYKKDAIKQASVSSICVARDARYKKLGVIPIKQATESGNYVMVDLPDRRLDMNDFIRRVQQEKFSYISTGLSIDDVYITAFNEWAEKMEDFYDKTGLYE